MDLNYFAISYRVGRWRTGDFFDGKRRMMPALNFRVYLFPGLLYLSKDFFHPEFILTW
jgi:hypothetical protein